MGMKNASLKPTKHEIACLTFEELYQRVAFDSVAQTEMQHFRDSYSSDPSMWRRWLILHFYPMK